MLLVRVLSPIPNRHCCWGRMGTGEETATVRDSGHKVTPHSPPSRGSSPHLATTFPDTACRPRWIGLGRFIFAVTTGRNTALPESL